MKRSFKCVHPKDGAEVEQECGCTNHIEGHVTFCKLHAAAPEMLKALKATEAAITLEIYTKGGALQESSAWAGLAGTLKGIIRKAEEGQ